MGREGSRYIPVAQLIPESETAINPELSFDLGLSFNDLGFF